MIIAQRKAMLTADAWRSFAFVMLTCAVVYGYAWLRKSFGNKLQYNIALFACLIALVLADMIPVNKRFFNDENFVTQKELDDPYKPQRKSSAIVSITRREKSIKTHAPVTVLSLSAVTRLSSCVAIKTLLTDTSCSITPM